MVVALAGGVVFVGSRVVVRRTARGEWVLPKGHIELGESREQAAVREVLEETGLATEPVALLGRTEFEQAGTRWQVDFYLLRTSNQTPIWGEHLGTDVFLVEPQDLWRVLSFANLTELCPAIVAAADRVRTGYCRSQLGQGKKPPV